MPVFTKRVTKDGNFEVFKDGQRISTGTPESISLSYPTATDISEKQVAEVTTIQQTPPVVSSEDDAQGFKTDTDTLDDTIAGISAEKEREEITPSPTIDTGGKQEGEDRTFEPTGDEATDAYLKLIQSKQEEADVAVARAEQQRIDYEQLFTTSLAAISATTAATISRLNTTFDKRIKEQNRINEIRVASVKAYGLGGGGRFTPVAFRDAITGREEEAADKVAELESQRNSLISEATTARDSGKSKLLREKMEDLKTVDKEINDKLDEIEKESLAQYKLLRDFRKEQEAEDKAKIERSRRAFSAIASRLLDEWEDDKDALFQKILTNPNITLSYADVFEIMEEARAKKIETETETEKTKREAEEAERKGRKTEADIKRTEALTQKTFADIEKAKREAGEPPFSKDDKLALEAAGLKDAPRDEQLEFVVTYSNLDKQDRADFIEETKGGGEGGSLKNQVNAKGFDYDAMKADGFSDEEIKEATGVVRATPEEAPLDEESVRKTREKEEQEKREKEDRERKKLQKEQKAEGKRQFKEFQKKEKEKLKEQKKKEAEEERLAREVRKAATEAEARKTINKLFPKKAEQDAVKAAEKVARDAEVAVRLAEKERRKEEELAALKKKRDKAREEYDAVFKKFFKT